MLVGDDLNQPLSESSSPTAPQVSAIRVSTGCRARFVHAVGTPGVARARSSARERSAAITDSRVRRRGLLDGARQPAARRLRPRAGAQPAAEGVLPADGK